MRRLAAVGAGLALAAAGVPAAVGAGGQVRDVTIPGKVFVPREVDALVGDTVVWRNGDASTHTVTANDDSFDSGDLAPGGTFAQSFAKPGLYPYHCTIHKFMRGVVRVVPVALSGTQQPVLAGGRIVLQGLAPAGTARVVVTQAAEAGARERAVVPSADGSFTLPLRIFAPAVFRASVGGRSSPAVRVAVAPRVRAALSGNAVVGDVVPARPGARLVLQRYDRERFAWHDVARSRVAAGRRFSLPLPSPPGRFRVVVRGSGGWADGFSAGVVRR